MNVAVCVKQIPDPTVAGRLDPRTGLLVRPGPLVLDEVDAVGVEMALRLAEQAGGGTVTAVSMAPGGVVGGLRSALAMGVARAVLVSDEALAGSDALVTAKVLAAVIARIGPDLVVTGTESTDGYCGVVAAQLAELLGLAAVTFVRRAEMVDGLLVAERQAEDGVDEVECRLPALLSVMAGAVVPRYPTFRGIRAARTAPLEVLSVADLGLPAGHVGEQGSRQRVVAVRSSPVRAGGTVVVDDGDGHLRILQFLD
ncbi:MAG: electron transfer flavoprotein subunit beta/FixA family protein, partial [Acidimicrobiales bacterium]